jgi:hypothetical protein
MKAFPVFRHTRGVLESNELYVHHVTIAQPVSPEQQLKLAEAARAEKASEAAAEFMQYPSETPILLEGLRGLRTTHPHLPLPGLPHQITVAAKLAP